MAGPGGDGGERTVPDPRPDGGDRDARARKEFLATFDQEGPEQDAAGLIRDRFHEDARKVILAEAVRSAVGGAKERVVAEAVGAAPRTPRGPPS